MTRVTILRATLNHARELAAAMRPDDALEVERLGLTPVDAATFSLEHSEEATAVLFDGKVAAIYGVSKRRGPDSVPDRIWCLTSTEVDAAPLTFWRESKAAVKRLALRERTMFAIIDSTYDAAVRWSRRLGFRAQETGEIRGHKFTLAVRRTSWASR